MTMIDYLWEHICRNDMTSMDELTRDRREDLEALDLYIRDCLEEWFINNERLSASSIVRLSNCSHELMLEIRRLNGAAPGYFEELRDLCQRVLRRMRVREARQTIARAYTACTAISGLAGSGEQAGKPSVNSLTLLCSLLVLFWCSAG